MGFECGFDKIKKIDNDPEKCLYKIWYKHYMKNPWATEHFNSFKEYMEYEYKPFYKDFECKYPDIKYDGEEDFENIEFWCSIGRYLDDFILENAIRIQPFEQYIIDSTFIDKTLETVQKALNADKLIPVTITHSFRYNEDGDKVMTLCDGILTQDENENEALIDLEYENIWIGSRHFDIDRYYALESLRDTLIEMKKIDFNEYYIFYYRSY